MNGNKRKKGKKPKPTKEMVLEKVASICQLYTQALPKAFFNSIAEDFFTVNLETLDLNGIIAVCESLKQLKTLSSIQLLGRFNPTALSAKNPSTKRPKAIISQVLKRKPFNFHLISRFFDGLSVNLSSNKSLQELTLSGLILSPNAWNILNNAIQTSTVLELLNIRYCSLSDTDLMLLQNAMKLNSLKRIDLSHNALKDEAGAVIGNAISNINNSQSQNVWKQNLREQKLPVLQKGLTEVCLSFNSIGDKGIVHLSHALFYDTILQSLELSNNKITHTGYEEIENVLITNSALIYINLRSNEPPRVELIYNIVDKLIRNYNSNKEQFWFNEEDWEEKIEDMQNFLHLVNNDSEMHTERRKGLKKRVGLGSEHTPLHLLGNKQEMKSCDKCEEFERELFKSKSQCVDLKIENNRLMKMIEKNKGQKNRN
jgi:hypothetical protein